jgi:hypothetical protein
MLTPHLPVTAASNFIDCLLLLIAWLIVGRRIKQMSGQVNDTVRRVRSYFGHFALFNAFMALPAVTLYAVPWLFPLAMGWGYAVANVFLLLSLSHLSRLAVKIMPQLAGRERLVQILWGVANVIMLGLNLKFVALANQPTFDPVTGVTQFHIPAFLGPILGTISLIAYVPGIILFTIAAVREHGDKRVRSILLALGMLIIMVVGPLHAVAATWQIFVLADTLNIISLALMAGGIMYRLAPKNIVE